MKRMMGVVIALAAIRAACAGAQNASLHDGSYARDVDFHNDRTAVSGCSGNRAPRA
jgi:hypothetical protein